MDFSFIKISENHQVTVYADGKFIVFPLQIVDGKYQPAEEVTKMISGLLEYHLRPTEIPVVANREELEKLCKPLPDFELAKIVRKQRSIMITSTDWTQIPDSLTEEKRNAWRKYRQELRDITKQRSFPHEVSWPIPPTEKGILKDLVGIDLTYEHGVPTPLI